ncbi:hypothetical protein [Vibrio phage VP9]|uniref:Uncharacterized protein n=1 Tax=Vibrio phage VP9 TaxID=3025410 RepID=A0AAF0CKC7_9CAUD|nr:hypothetical protein [Vibrio phage VP9]
MRTKVINNATLHNDWDDLQTHQFLVVWHSSGKTCDVFVMGGADYGGGVLQYGENMDSVAVETLIHSNTTCYDQYRSILDAVKEHNDGT